MFDRVLNLPLGDTSRLEKLSKCVLIWKRSVFIVLPIIWNQSKIKAIPHTVFETFINSNSWYKTQKIHGGESLLELAVVHCGSFKCYKVFALKVKKGSPKRCESPKINKNSSHNKRCKRDIEKGEKRKMKSRRKV